MKYALTVLLAVGLVSVASAQYNRPYDNGHERNYDWHSNDSRNYNAYSNWDVNQINHYYDQKVWEVQNDYTLRPVDKRHIIREINEERKYRIRAARKQNRREGRRWDDDDDD